jgi:hypothetical protein
LQKHCEDIGLIERNIEQFFKTLKHVLKISEPRTKTKDEFENKFLKFAFLAIKRYHGCFCMNHFVCSFAHKRTYRFLRSVISYEYHASEEAFCSVLRN